MDKRAGRYAPTKTNTNTGLKSGYFQNYFRNVLTRSTGFRCRQWKVVIGTSRPSVFYLILRLVGGILVRITRSDT